MITLATFITALAALVSALAWPLLISVAIMFFRKEIYVTRQALPIIIQRMIKVKIGLFEVELGEKADDLLEEAVANPGEISDRQIRFAASIRVAASALSDEVLRDQLKQLCYEYESIRGRLPAGANRTRAMTAVLVRMRTLASSVKKFLEELKSSSSAGNHLAAIAIMQMDLTVADGKWLLERFTCDAPFIFFQAATIIDDVITLRDSRTASFRFIASQALNTINKFKGVPDAETIDVLSLAISR